MSRVLVTGSAGFIGSSLVEELLSLGHEVIGVDSLTDYYSPDLKSRNLQVALKSANYKFINGDLNELDLIQLLDSIDVVFHQAGQPGVRKSWGTDFDIYTDQNIRATQRLLEAAKVSKISKFVYASSSSIYGSSKTYPVTEANLPVPNSPYGVTKLSAEQLCVLYAKNFSVPTVSLRYFTVYGPRQRPDMAFTRFIMAGLAGDEIEVFGNGEQIRDFTFISDVVAANIAVGFQDVPSGSVFNVAGGGSVTLNEAIAVIERLIGSSLKIKYKETVSGDVIQTGGSTQLLESQTGWKPKVSLEVGLARHVEWAREL